MLHHSPYDGLVLLILIIVTFYLKLIDSKVISTVRSYPVCANLSFTSTGGVDLIKILYECQVNIPGSNSPPSFFLSPNGTFDPVIVKNGWNINNFMGVDDLKATISLDFYWRLQWSDPRLNFPDMWKYMNPEIYKEGLDITNYIRDIQNPLLYWLPDIAFYQVLDMNMVAELIKVYQNGTLYWSRHVVATFAEPAISFEAYPLDQQNFSIVMQSYAFDINFLTLTQYANPITYNGDVQNGVNYIQENQLWTYEDYSYYTVIENLGSPLNPERRYSTSYVNLRFKRQSLGIIYRLALPVIMFVAVVGIAFYGELGERISVTLEILLVIAALYIVIGQTIPLVGYLTTMDKFMLFVFTILSLAIGIHFGSAMLDASVYALPMNYFFSALMDFTFRFLWIPLTLVGFIRFFDITVESLLITLYAVCALSLFHSWKRLKSLRRALEYSILQLFIKKDRIDSFKAQGISYKQSKAYVWKNPSLMSLTRSRNKVARQLRDEDVVSEGNSGKGLLTVSHKLVDDTNIEPSGNDDDDDEDEKSREGDGVVEIVDCYQKVESEGDEEQQKLPGQPFPVRIETLGSSGSKTPLLNDGKEKKISRMGDLVIEMTDKRDSKKLGTSTSSAKRPSLVKRTPSNKLLKTMLASYRHLNGSHHNIFTSGRQEDQHHRSHATPPHQSHHQYHQHQHRPHQDRVGEKDRSAHMLIKSISLTWFERYVIHLWEKFFGVTCLADIEHWKEDFEEDDDSNM